MSSYHFFAFLFDLMAVLFHVGVISFVLLPRLLFVCLIPWLPCLFGLFLFHMCYELGNIMVDILGIENRWMFKLSCK